MGYVETIDYDNYPEQSKNIGRRVVVCYKYDTTKMHEGEIIRDDVGEPGETLIKLDNGRYLRAAECMFQFVNEE